MIADMRLVPSRFAPEIGNALAIALIATAGLYTFAWIFDPKMTFYTDDWVWFDHAVFSDWSEFATIWTVLPNSFFHDRPIEYAIVKLLYQLYHLDYARYAATILLIHIANALLLYCLAARLLASRFYAMLVAVLFVIDYNTAWSAWWLSTIADSMSLLFCLCAFCVFLSRRRGTVALAVLCYYLAMKAKESALPFPFMLLACSFLWQLRSWRWPDVVAALRGALRATWPLLAAFAWFLGFFLYYYLQAKRGGGTTALGVYAPQLDVPTFIEGTKLYLQNIAFDLPSPGVALAGFVGLAAIAVLSLNRAAILGALGFFVGTGAVLFLAQQRSPYYAYAATAYVALMLVALVQQLANATLPQRAGPAEFGVKLALLAAVVWFTYYSYGLVLYRAWTIDILAETSKAMTTLSSAAPRIEDNSTIVITGTGSNPGANLFTFAPCHAIKVMYKLKTIHCQIEGSDAALQAEYDRAAAPKLLLNYDHGYVALTAHSP